MVNNFTNISKTRNHLSPQLIDHNMWHCKSDSANIQCTNQVKSERSRTSDLHNFELLISTGCLSFVYICIAVGDSIVKRGRIAMWWSTISPISAKLEIIFHLNSLTTTCDIANLSPGLGQAQQCGRVRAKGHAPQTYIILNSWSVQVVYHLFISVLLLEIQLSREVGLRYHSPV
jgi:hypothetical protein